MSTLQWSEAARTMNSPSILSGPWSALSEANSSMATVASVDVLVSWNFKHIVNLQRIHGYNSVNLRRGYPLIEIRAPREVSSDE